MADLALGALSLVKEVYLLSRFIIRTGKSAYKHDAERLALLEEYDYEFFYLRSFGQFFFDQSSLGSDGIDPEWLQKIEWILNNLRLGWADYSRLAIELDPAYRQYSPYNSQATPYSRLLEFPAMRELIEQQNEAITINSEDSENSAIVVAQNAASNHVNGIGNSNLNVPIELATTKKKLKILDFNLKWALWEKRKLEKSLVTTRKWTGKLRELAPYTMAVNPRHYTLPASELQLFTAHSDATVLGLGPHANLRQISDGSNSSPTEPMDLSEKGYVLNAQAQTAGLRVGQLLKQNSGTRPCDVLTEYKRVKAPAEGEASTPDDTEEARMWQLARLLTCSDVKLGTLHLKGVMPAVLHDSSAFIFDVPSWASSPSPVTLLDLIARPMTRSPGLTLAKRFAFAQTIASYLAALHADKWVHKSFRSQSIVFFRGSTNTVDYSKPLLVNFEFARSVDSKTRWDYDDDDEKNLYRHPDRQGPPKRAFTRIHDLYALGVVLLEIGLWKRVLHIRDEMQTKLPPHETLDADTFRDKLVELAEKELPPVLGEDYAGAVKVCLESTFEVEEDDPRFTMAVYEQVVEKIRFGS